MVGGLDESEELVQLEGVAVVDVGEEDEVTGGDEAKRAPALYIYIYIYVRTIYWARA